MARINVQRGIARPMTKADEDFGRGHRAERRARSVSRLAMPRGGFTDRVRHAQQFSVMTGRRMRMGSPRASEEEPEDV